MSQSEATESVSYTVTAVSNDCGRVHRFTTVTEQEARDMVWRLRIENFHQINVTRRTITTTKTDETLAMGDSV